MTGSHGQLVRQVGSWQVAIVFAPGQEPLARDVLDTLARIQAREPLRHGMRVRFGWSLLTLEERTPGRLTVCEPDFESDPVRVVRPRVDTTLDVLLAQVTLLRRIGVAPADVAFDQILIARRGALEQEVVQFIREPATAHDDSGWRAVRLDQGSHDPADYEEVPVYALVSTHRPVMAALALPTGYAAQIAGGRVTAVFDAAGENLLR